MERIPANNKFGGGGNHVAREKTPWGTVTDTGAGAIDTVMREFPLGREVTEFEIIAAIKRKGLKERNAIPEHMRTLTERGHVAKTDNGWKRITA